MTNIVDTYGLAQYERRLDLDVGDLYFDVVVNGIRWRGEYELDSYGEVVRYNADLGAAEWAEGPNGKAGWRAYLSEWPSYGVWSSLREAFSTLASLDEEPTPGHVIPKTAAAMLEVLDRQNIFMAVEAVYAEVAP